MLSKPTQATKPTSSESKKDLDYHIRKIQEIRKLHLSRRRTRLQTSKDLGEKSAIDIDKKSTENLKKIKERLKNPTLLPNSEQKIVLNEKRNPTDILTQKEIALFNTLLNKKYFLHHTTSAATLDTIQKNGKALLDPQEASRQGISERVTTTSFGGIENNIFFGFGSKSSTLPFFVRRRTNKVTKQPEDYATVWVDYTKLYQDHSASIKNSWSSGHFAHYEQAVNREKSLPILIGDTSFNYEYDIENPLNPEKSTPVKYLIFQRKDKTTIKQRVELGDEIASGNQFLTYFAFSFIERLRYIGGETRKHLLEHPEDTNTIDMVIEKAFRVSDFEMHIPTKFTLSPDYTEIVTPEKRKQITELVSKAASQGDIKLLTDLEQKKYPLDDYMYIDPFYDSKLSPVDLPLCSAIKAKDSKTIDWLISHNANKPVFIKENDGLDEEQREENNIRIISNVLILSAAFESGDLKILDSLIAKGLDPNAYYTYVLKNSEQGQLTDIQAYFKPDNWDKGYKYSDQVFLFALKAASKNGKLEIIDRAMQLLNYCKNPDVLEKRILRDLARSANERVFNYVKDKYLSKFTITDYDYVNLLSLATCHNNLVLLPSLAKHIPQDNLKISDFIKNTALRALRNDNVEACELIMSLFNIKPADIIDVQVFRYIFKSIAAKWAVEKLDIQSIDLIMGAIDAREFETAKWLIERTPKHKDEKSNFNINYNELLKAAFYYDFNLEFSDYLASKGAKLPDSKKHLMKAIERRNIEEIQWIIKHDNSIDLSNVILTTMPDSTPSILKLLLQNGGVLPDKSKANHLFRYTIESRNLEMLNELSTHYTFDPKLYDDVFLNTLSADDVCIYNKNKNHIGTIEWMLNHGVNANTADAKGESAFHTVFESDNYFWDKRCKIFELLIQHGATIKNTIDSHGANALVKTILCGRSSLDQSEWLIKHGVDINKKANAILVRLPSEWGMDITPLQAACFADNPILVKGLLRRGANPDLTDDLNNTALHFACGKLYYNSRYEKINYNNNPNLENINLLLSSRTKLNVGEISPLTILCLNHTPSLPAVDLLLQAGADPNYGTKMTPLIAALLSDNPNVELITKLLAVSSINKAVPFDYSPVEKPIAPAFSPPDSDNDEDEKDDVRMFNSDKKAAPFKFMSTYNQSIYMKDDLINPLIAAVNNSKISDGIVMQLIKSGALPPIDIHENAEKTDQAFCLWLTTQRPGIVKLINEEDRLQSVAADTNHENVKPRLSR